jgi:hypothetical protein
MKNIKIVFLSFVIVFSAITTKAQNADPTIAVAPSNSGIVAVGATIDIIVTVGNALAGNIAPGRMRPVIQVPLSVTFPATQPVPPSGWTILTNSGSQIRLCNSSANLAGNGSIDIILKVQGVTVSPAQTFSGTQFGGIACANGPAVPGNVAVNDAATSTIEVVSPCGLTVTATAGTILCNAGITTITASGTDVTGAIEYSINGGTYQTSNVFTGIVAGSYTVAGRQVSNPFCINSTSLTVLEPAALQAPIVSIIQPTCASATGIVTITSPTIGLTFSLDGSTSFVSYTAPFLFSTGSHTIQAKNADGCLSPIISITINSQPTTPLIPIVGNITQPNCSISTGTLVLSGLPSGNWTINPGNVTGNTASTTLNNLPAGTYNYTVTNDVGCSSLPTSAVTINAVLGAPLAPTVTLVQPTCTSSTGTIIVTSPTIGLLFSLDTGTYTSYPAGGFTNVGAGNHTLIVQNVSGCLSPFTNIIINAQPASPPPPVVTVVQPTCTVSTGILLVTSDTTGVTFSLDGAGFASYPIGGFTLVPTGTHNLQIQNLSGCTPSVTNNIIVNTQPASPSASISATLITCFGGNSTLTAIGTGGTLPYEFSLNNSGPFQISNTFNVVAGTYFVTVKGANGCTITTNNLIVGQPTVVSATISAGSIACRGGITSLTVLAAGGSGTLEYSLNNSTNFQTSNIFTNLSAGTYSVRVRPILNPTCITTTPSLVITQLDSVKISASALPINLCGGTTVVAIVGSGGRSPYTGTGTFVKGPGKWSFTVIDANGCTATSQLIILPPGCVELSVFPNPAQNSITVNHPATETTSAIQIFEADGHRVLSSTIAPNAFISTLNISTLASGVYILVYVNGNEKKEIKFIKTISK